MRTARPIDSPPAMRRAVGRWQLYGLSINDVIGSGIYLLPAAAALLLGPISLWAVLLAGLAVSLLVLCYAQAASYFDQPGGGYLYAREAFGPFIGFEVGWMLLLTRVASAAALSNGLAEAVTHFWPQAASGGMRIAIIVGSLGLLVGINVLGVRAAARTGVFLAITKVVPLLLFVGIGAWYVDMSLATPLATPPSPRALGEAALLLLFAYAGFENLPAAAGEYRNPRRDVPFAMLSMIATVTAIYVAVQWVALGTLPGLAQSQTPLAEAAARFGGGWLALVLTVGAAVSILGTNSNTIMLGPRYLHALAIGWLRATRAGQHPSTPADPGRGDRHGRRVVAGAGVVGLLRAIGVAVGDRTAVHLHRHRAVRCWSCGARMTSTRAPCSLPGGALIPVLAAMLAVGLLASASWRNLLAGAIALLVGAIVYRFRRTPPTT